MENTIENYIQLNDGNKMPRVGFGTHEVSGTVNIVYEAIKQGVRHIDTASFYKNEKSVGEGISQAISEKLVTRDELYVVTKVWIDQMDDPEKAIKESLAELNLSYVDLYLVHWPFNKSNSSDKINFVPQHVLWPAMESLVDRGLTRSIGVSNYNVQSLLNLFSFCRIKPVCNQIEYHPYLQQKKLVEFCQKYGIVIVAYNSLCGGTYTRENQTRELSLLKEPLITELSTKYNKSTGQIALNWALTNNAVVIPKTAKAERIKENLESLNFRLNDEDMKKLDQLDLNYRFNNTEFWSGIDIMA